MVFLDFERDLESLYEQLDKIKQVGEKGDLDTAPIVAELEGKIAATRQRIHDNLTGWQRVQLSRHPERPYTLFYVSHMTEQFVELHGDRAFGDDKAMVGGLGRLGGQTVMFVGQQKGVNTKMRQYRNFGMPNPEGYRKALRLMKLAERFGFPVVCLIDTPGAFPGIEAEERGQAEAIARNLVEMAQLRVPIVSCVIGEGASGGAIGIGLSDRAYMMENTWYSVISPESCSSILWRSWDQKERAAEELHLTAADMLRFGIIDGIIAEPLEGAHGQPEEMSSRLRSQLLAAIAELKRLPVDELIRRRIEKYDNIGVFREDGAVQFNSAAPELPVAPKDAAPLPTDESPLPTDEPPLPKDAAEPDAAPEHRPGNAPTTGNADADPAVTAAPGAKGPNGAKSRNGKSTPAAGKNGRARSAAPVATPERTSG